MSQHQTQPRRFKSGRPVTATALADPSITIIEIGQNFGFLLAESCSETGVVSARLHLEQVNWVRRVNGQGILDQLRRKQNFQVRAFSEIAIYRHETGPFVAQDLASQGYIPWPSATPYIVIFLTRDQYDELHQEIAHDAFEQFIASMKTVTEDIADFAFDGNALTGPDDYACAHVDELDRELIAI